MMVSIGEVDVVVVEFCVGCACTLRLASHIKEVKSVSFISMFCSSSERSCRYLRLQIFSEKEMYLEGQPCRRWRRIRLLVPGLEVVLDVGFPKIDPSSFSPTQLSPFKSTNPLVSRTELSTIYLLIQRII